MVLVSGYTNTVFPFPFLAKPHSGLETR